VKENRSLHFSSYTSRLKWYRVTHAKEWDYRASIKDICTTHKISKNCPPSLLVRKMSALDQRTHHKFRKIRCFTKSAEIHIWRPPSPLFEKCPHWTTSSPPWLRSSFMDSPIQTIVFPLQLPKITREYKIAYYF